MGFILLILVSVPLGVFSVVYENRLIDKNSQALLVYKRIHAELLARIVMSLCLWSKAWNNIGNRIRYRRSYDNCSILFWILDFFGVLIRLIRANLIDVMNKDFIRACRAKGLGTTRILFVHGLKNALIPVITRSTSIILHLVTGSAVVETIFSIKGVGYLALNAVSLKDLPVIQCYIIVVFHY